MKRCQLSQLHTPNNEEWGSRDEQSVGPFISDACERGIDLARISADGSLDITTMKRKKPKEVIATGGYLLVNETFDDKKPVAQQFCLDLCRIS